VLHGDLSTVRFGGNLWYPRVLLDGSADHDGDGQADPALQCWDPLDCSQKCRYLERTARHGAGAPQPCAMCKSPHAHTRSHTHCLIRLFFAPVVPLTDARLSSRTKATNTVQATCCRRATTFSTRFMRTFGP
jgi:hypothetical protein